MFLLLLGFLFKREAQQLTLCKCNELLLSLFAGPDFFLLSFTGCANNVCVCVCVESTVCMFLYVCKWNKQT